MAQARKQLEYDLDNSAFVGLAESLGATYQEMMSAYRRAMKRTTVTMKALSNRTMRDGMDAKSLKVIKRRMQAYRSDFGLRHSRALGELKLWYGLNDIGVSKLKGRPYQTRRGAAFASKRLGISQFENAFVGRVYGRRSVFKRQGRSVSEGKVNISDRLQVELEDEVFDDVPDVFLRHFETDLRGRVAARGVIKERQPDWAKYKGWAANAN